MSAATPAGARAERRSGPDADPESVARSIVLRQLTASARTRAELQKTLDRRKVPQDVASHVLDRMEEVGLVDDRAYAQAFVESRRNRSGWSRQHIRRWLGDRGVDRETVSEVLEALVAEDEEESAVAFVRSRWRRNRHLDDGVRQRRLLAALARRGYTAEVARSALESVAQEEGDG